jgi:hypothetical protein
VIQSSIFKRCISSTRRPGILVYSNLAYARARRIIVNESRHDVEDGSGVAFMHPRREQGSAGNVITEEERKGEKEDRAREQLEKKKI